MHHPVTVHKDKKYHPYNYFYYSYLGGILQLRSAASAITNLKMNLSKSVKESFPVTCVTGCGSQRALALCQLQAFIYKEGWYDCSPEFYTNSPRWAENHLPWNQVTLFLIHPPKQECSIPQIFSKICNLSTTPSWMLHRCTIWLL